VDGRRKRILGGEAVVSGDDDAGRARAQVCAQAVFRIDVAENPAAAVVPEEEGPSLWSGWGSRWDEYADGDGWAGGFETGDLDVDGFPDGEGIGSALEMAIARGS
jgi:hypothetical protein